ncbi:hypothetical protein [Limnobacter sp. P1]|jgi:hypothetical protein|uniref:hypothetical protein n=1 Tax=Limnobacter olei TaxID=3031298 RepID=UPI0023AF53EC|nr:hypothetical protein [Limnobacter sp. P1]
MTINNSNSTVVPRQISSMTRNLSQIGLEEQARPTKKAALTIASETLRNEQALQIICHCNAINQEIPLIRVNTRRALSTYLIDNQVNNPGLLTQRQEDLCAWTLLEHAAREDRNYGKITSGLISSYVRPTEKPRFESLAKSMSLNPAKYLV